MKHLLMSRSMREKILVLLMLIVGLLIWISFFGDRAQALLAERGQLNRRQSEMNIYLDNREIIQERAEAGIASLEPSRTLDATRLLVEAADLADKHNLNPSIDSPRTEAGEIFSYHTVVLTVQNAKLETLMSFTGELQSRAPYIALEEVIITAKTDPQFLDARYRISSVELNP